MVHSLIDHKNELYAGVNYVARRLTIHRALILSVSIIHRATEKEKVDRIIFSNFDKLLQASHESVLRLLINKSQAVISSIAVSLFEQI